MKRTFSNPNTPKLWDKRLFDTNEELLRSPFYIDKLNKVYRFLKNQKGNFLDIGFGAANLEKKILSRGTNLQIYGIDFSKKAVENAKKSFAGSFYVAKSQRLPFKNSFFDFVVMLDVLEHIPEVESKKVLGEIRRVLTDKGNFVLSVPLNEDLQKMNKEGTNFNAHLREYSSRILEDELKKSGLETFKKEFIFAFSNYYFLKSLIIKMFPNFRKPNLLIIYARKR